MKLSLVAVAVILASITVLTLTGHVERWISRVQPQAAVEVVVVTPTPQVTIVVEVPVTATPSPIVPTATVPPSPTPTPEPTPTPTPAPPIVTTGESGLSIDQLSELRLQMLTLINDARREHGLIEVVLDDNPTAQLHAEDSRANCFSGHWGSNGMKPSMRYTLNGGIHYSAENVSGSDYCPSNPHRYRDESLSSEVLDAHQGLMNSPGHRRNILDPSHRKVGIGFSYERPNLWVVQLFTSDHIEFSLTPRIEGGELTFAYRLINGARDSNETPPSAAVFFDPLPYDLTRGQLARTYCVGSGPRIAHIRPQARPGRFWTTEYFEDELSPCPDPYRVNPNAEPPQSYDEASRLHDEAKLASNETTPTITGPWITSHVDPLPIGGYHVVTDLSAQIAHYGPGVYSLVIWADVNGESAQVSNFAIFVESTQVEVPATAEPDREVAQVAPVPETLPTATPSPAPTPEPTATPTPEPPVATNGGSGLRPDQLAALRLQMLTLINDARREHGLVEVVLDDNPTAQLHAEDARANCFSSHWGSNGMKPYMRYTLNGGIHYSAENASGSNFCPSNPDRYAESSLSSKIVRAHNGLMNSPGHRRNILNPAHRKVGLGNSFMHPNFRVVQLFTSDHIEFTIPPRIEGGDLIFAYKLVNFAEDSAYPPDAYVHYDRPPHELTRGQLARTYCYGSGQRIAAIRPQAGQGSSWSGDYFQDEHSPCPNPYDVDPDTDPPRSSDEEWQLHTDAIIASNSRTATVTVPWITSEVQPLAISGYHVITDLSAQIGQFGPGVYTVVIWAEINGESAPVSSYSIFLE